MSARQETSSTGQEITSSMHRPSKPTFAGRFWAHRRLHRSASTDGHTAVDRNLNTCACFLAVWAASLDRCFIQHCARALSRMIGPATMGSNSRPSACGLQALFRYIHCQLFTLSGSTYASICRLADPQQSYESSTPT